MDVNERQLTTGQHPAPSRVLCPAPVQGDLLLLPVCHNILLFPRHETFSVLIGGDEEQKDPNEEFISTQKFNTGRMVEKFYFEEESSL